jgi:crossover junction endodeoxyribonuclease RusA
MKHNESFIIILPLPSKVLSPNCMVGSIGGRYAKAAAAKKQRRLACEAIHEAIQADRQGAMVVVTPTFYHKTNRRRDTDNAMGSLKSVYDGIVDSGLVPDDTPEYMERKMPVFKIDKQWPRLEIEIEIHDR